MNKHDTKVLRMNWEPKKNQLKNANYMESMDISNGCYVDFGTYGISVWKYLKGKWSRKIVNGWKSLSFEQFMTELNNQEWEVV